MSASVMSITRGCDNVRGIEIGIENENESGKGKGKGKEIHERRKPINAMGWVISTQLFQHLCRASLMTGPRMWATLILRCQDHRTMILMHTTRMHHHRMSTRMSTRIPTPILTRTSINTCRAILPLPLPLLRT